MVEITAYQIIENYNPGNQLSSKTTQGPKRELNKLQDMTVTQNANPNPQLRGQSHDNYHITNDRERN